MFFTYFQHKNGQPEAIHVKLASGLNFPLTENAYHWLPEFWSKF